MKKWIVISALLICAASPAISQVLSADEMLEKLNCTDFQCFNGFIVSKGFTYNSSQKDKMWSWYLFETDNFVNQATETTRTKNIAGIGFVDSSSTFVSFATANKAYYLELLKQFKAKGFVYEKADNSNGVVEQYKSQTDPNISLVISYNRRTQHKDSWTEYDFKLTKER